VWDPDDLSGIGFVANITGTAWTETDDYGNGCAVTFSYTVDGSNHHVKQATALGDKCPAMPLYFLNESGRLEFSSDHKFMYEYYDPAPDDDIVAFKWMRQ